MVPPERIGLSTSPLPRVCSTTELRRLNDRQDAIEMLRVQEKMVFFMKIISNMTKVGEKGMVGQ